MSDGCVDKAVWAVSVGVVAIEGCWYGRKTSCIRMGVVLLLSVFHEMHVTGYFYTRPGLMWTSLVNTPMPVRWSKPLAADCPCGDVDGRSAVRVSGFGIGGVGRMRGGGGVWAGSMGGFSYCGSVRWLWRARCGDLGGSYDR